MVAHFPLPVLSVAADAVRDLEGRDALSGLWTLFTKCKESLQDGRRLENISWRLWYREMMLSNQEREFGYSDNTSEYFSSEKDKVNDEALSLNEKSTYQPPTPSESVPIPPPYSAQDSSAPVHSRPTSPHLQTGTSPAPSSATACASHSVSTSPATSRSIPNHKRRPSISRSRRSSFLNGNSGSPVCVGKMIYDMLPSSASASASSSTSSNSTDSSKGGLAALFLPGPVISRRTSSASSSGGDSEIKAHQDQMASNARLRLDPNIQMTPIGSGSSSPASSPPAALTVAEGAALRPTKLPDPSPNNPILPPQDGGSSLPTPEMEAEPDAMIIRATNTPTNPIASTSTSPFASPASTTPTLSLNVKHSESTLISATAPSPATSLALSNNSNDPSDNSTFTHDTSDSTSMALSSPPVKAVYTGPPSPSLSDSYARAHPGEVEVKEVGLMPSLSSNTNDITSNQMVGLSQQPQAQPESSVQHQTPPSASSTMTIPLMHTPPQQQPPTLVVVNPTPNPTPHPTPPTTPLLHGTIGPGGLIRSQWLTLPEGAVGGGARQHQLLQAAQQQMQQMQASHHQMTALRLPPPVGAGVGLGVAPNANATFLPGHVDRSRSVTRGLSEVSYGAAASGTSTSSRGVVSSDFNYANSNISASEQLQPPVREQSYQGSLERDTAQQQEDEDPCLRQEQAPYQQQQQQRSLTRDKGNRHSMSSTTSSNHSHISDRSSAGGRAESTTTNTTVSSSEAEQQHQDILQDWSSAEKAAMFDAHHGLLQKQLGSLSTIQSMSTLADGRKDVGPGAAGDVLHSRSASAGEEDGGDEAGVCVINDEAVGEEDDAPLSPLPPPGGLAMSPHLEKRRKRNSAPAMLTLSPTASTGSASGQPSAFTASPKSASTSSAISGPQHGKRRTVTAGGAMTRRASSSSRSRSAGGSSAGKSRSRSREPGVGLGGFGMTAAAPPPAITARKASTVAGGRGRTKVVLGRTGFKAKGAVLRRNSSGLGTAAAAEAEALEQELQREQVEGEQRERMRAEALEKERQRNLQQAEDKRRVEEQALAIGRERIAREERMRAEEEERLEEERQRHREKLEALAAGVEAGGSKRPVRFNIGSNSDEGSGMGSKSVGSGSDASGGPQGDGRGGRAEDLGASLSSKGKGKERQRDIDQRDMVQQLHHQLQQHQEQQRQHQQQPDSKDQLNLQQHLQRQMSKQQLHQLQKMQQLHQQHQNQTTIHQHHPQQYQQQFQHQQQLLQLGQAHHLPPTSRQVSAKQLESGVIRDEEERVGELQKGKGKETEVVAPKPTKSTSKVNVALDDDLAAQVKQHLAAPLLPQNRRTIVLATSESDFETDSEDEGSWSSEEMTGEESEEPHAREEQLRQQEMQRQQLLQQQQQQQVLQQRQHQQQHQQNQVQQQQQSPPIRPPGVQRTQSSHYPAPNNGRGGKQVSRAQQQQNRQAQLNAQAIMKQAALEAQRQREMFVKLPTSSFQNLANARTRSVGLLTQLMNPNPDIFPVNHPYRRGFSSGEIRPTGKANMTPMRPLPPAASVVPEHAPATEDVSNQVVADSVIRPPHHRRSTDAAVTKKSGAAPGPSRYNFSPPSGMQRTKSAAALPVSSQIMAGSVVTKAPPMIDLTSAMLANGVMSGGYRPKGPPKDQELDSDSEAETGIQVSSVAQERLKVLAQRSRILTNAGRNAELDRAQPPPQAGPSHFDDNDVPQWARVSQPQQQHTRSQSQGQPPSRRPPNGLLFTQMANNDLPNSVAHPNPAPIPLGYPYNLPVPPPPSTPRTTRRLMLSTELPESLRRNLLWERQVSKVNLAGVKRSASGGGSRHSILGGIQPLTAAPSMVQLHAKGTGPPDNSNDDGDFIKNGGGVRERETDDQKRKAMARNKSWANNYHYSGW